MDSAEWRFSRDKGESDLFWLYPSEVVNFGKGLDARGLTGSEVGSEKFDRSMIDMLS